MKRKKIRLFLGILFLSVVLAVVYFLIGPHRDAELSSKEGNALSSSEINTLELANRFLQKKGKDLTAQDIAEIEKIGKTLSPQGKTVLTSLIQFSAIGKKVQITEVEQFETISSEIRKGNIENVKSLISESKNQTALRSAYGYNFLMVACLSGASPEMVKTIIDSGVDVNARDNLGRTAAHQYILAGAVNDRILQILKQNHADFNQKDNEGISVNDMLAARH